MGYFPEGAFDGNVGAGGVNPLVHVVKNLSPTAKQAMFAASQKGLIARGTWDGCAFNAGSLELGGNVASYGTAAELFGMPVYHVERFIEAWDNLQGSDEEANRLLVEALTDVGTHTPTGASRGKRIVRGYAYKSAATKFAEQLESGELTVDMIPGCKEVGALLSATC